MSAEAPLTLESITAEVAPHGFSLNSHAGDRSSFSFVDPEGMHLQVFVQDRSATLLHVRGLFTISTGTFSWPHPRFAALFLDKLREMKSKLDAPAA